jgi:hypothetical protein
MTFLYHIQLDFQISQKARGKVCTAKFQPTQRITCVAQIGKANHLALVDIKPLDMRIFHTPPGFKPKTRIDRPQHPADQIAMRRHAIYTSSPQTKVLDDASSVHTTAFSQRASAVFHKNQGS